MPGIFRSKLNIQRWRGTQPNVLVSGRVDASVGAMAANVLTAAAIASAAFMRCRSMMKCSSGVMVYMHTECFFSTSRALGKYLLRNL